MNKKSLLKTYFQELEKGSYQDILKLFAKDAKVHSPLYGQMEAARFYKQLFLDTQTSKITLKNIFVNPENDDIAAAHFMYAWTLKDGTLVRFECMDVFEFVPQSDQIQCLTIIYDTFHTRGFKKPLPPPPKKEPL